MGDVSHDVTVTVVTHDFQDKTYAVQLFIYIATYADFP